MKTFISNSSSELFKQVVATIQQQEEHLSIDEKKHYPFWKRAIDAAVQTYHANKRKVYNLSFIGSLENGYSLTVNNETCSFLIEREEVSCG